MYIENSIEINVVFEGCGYLIVYINVYFDWMLVFFIEVKKVFMEEDIGIVYFLVLNVLCSGFKGVLS